LKTPSRHRDHLTPNRWAQWWPIPLRLIVGYGFMEHGYAKLARGPESFANILHALGVPFPSLMAWATIAVELLGGLLILLGAFVTLASIPEPVLQPGYETDLLYLAALMALVLGGPGPLSVDRLLLRWGIDTNWPWLLRRPMGDREG